MWNSDACLSSLSSRVVVESGFIEFGTCGTSCSAERRRTRVGTAAVEGAKRTSCLTTRLTSTSSVQLMVPDGTRLRSIPTSSVQLLVLLLPHHSDTLCSILHQLGWRTTQNSTKRMHVPSSACAAQLRMDHLDMYLPMETPWGDPWGSIQDPWVEAGRGRT